MNKVFEQIIEKLEERRMLHADLSQSDKLTEQERGVQSRFCGCFCKAIEIVKQEAEQYNNAIIDGKYCFQSCACTEKCDKCSRLRNGDIDWYENIDNWT